MDVATTGQEPTRYTSIMVDFALAMQGALISLNHDSFQNFELRVGKYLLVQHR